MARDADGKPIETRGRRSISQRARDLSERLRSLGTLFDGSPKMLETVFTGAFFGSVVYFLRPTIVAVSTTSPTPLATFKGRPVDRLEIHYEDRAWAENLSILTALIVAPDIGGDIGSLLAPAGTALVFKKFIEISFPSPEVFPAYDLAFGPKGAKPGGGGEVPVDATLAFFTKVILPRWLRALFIASLFYILLRYIRNIGRS